MKNQIEIMKSLNEQIKSIHESLEKTDFKSEEGKKLMEMEYKLKLDFKNKYGESMLIKAIQSQVLGYKENKAKKISYTNFS